MNIVPGSAPAIPFGKAAHPIEITGSRRFAAAR